MWYYLEISFFGRHCRVWLISPEPPAKLQLKAEFTRVDFRHLITPHSKNHLNSDSVILNILYGKISRFICVFSMCDFGDWVFGETDYCHLVYYRWARAKSTHVNPSESSGSHCDCGAVLADAAGRDGGTEGAYGEERARYRGEGQRVSGLYHRTSDLCVIRARRFKHREQWYDDNVWKNMYIIMDDSGTHKKVNRYPKVWLFIK